MQQTVLLIAAGCWNEVAIQSGQLKATHGHLCTPVQLAQLALMVKTRD